MKSESDQPLPLCVPRQHDGARRRLRLLLSTSIAVFLSITCAVTGCASRMKTEDSRKRIMREFTQIGEILDYVNIGIGHLPFPVRRENVGQPNTGLESVNGTGRPLCSLVRRRWSIHGQCAHSSPRITTVGQPNQ